jgi:hypothetical protein
VKTHNELLFNLIKPESFGKSLSKPNLLLEANNSLSPKLTKSILVLKNFDSFFLANSVFFFTLPQAFFAKIPLNRPENALEIIVPIFLSFLLFLTFLFLNYLKI